MKKMNRKGFTIVELVIVIAVIAILAGVLIPTFSGIVKKAQDSAALQEATAAYKEAFALAISTDGSITANEVTEAGGFKFTWTNDKTATVQPKDGFGHTVKIEAGKVVIGATCPGHEYDTGEGVTDNYCNKCGAKAE